ncbi:hypothetical protein niasHS_011271 [Heterodera schachtii]|uniref:Uncharacterized protein n=2 Tax=Heterodera TaxID=34509 RepID=A0ABD2IU13_HETSC
MEPKVPRTRSFVLGNIVSEITYLQILTKEELLEETQGLTQLTAKELDMSESLAKLLLNLYKSDEKTLTDEFKAAADKGAFFEGKKSPLRRQRRRRRMTSA